MTNRSIKSNWWLTGRNNSNCQTGPNESNSQTGPNESKWQTGLLSQIDDSLVEVSQIHKPVQLSQDDWLVQTSQIDKPVQICHIYKPARWQSGKPEQISEIDKLSWSR